MTITSTGHRNSEHEILTHDKHFTQEGFVILLDAGK